jgi:hypothetical protein
MPTKEQLQKDAQRTWAKRNEEEAIHYLKFHTPEGKKERETVALKEKLDSNLSTNEKKASNKPFKA